MTTSRALRRASAATAAAALGLAGAAFAVQPAMAATLTVTNTLDAGDGSLRHAIDQANLTAEPDTIVFEGLTGSIELLSTVEITAPLTITGPGVDALTVTRDGTFDLFLYNNVGAPGDLTVSNLAFQAGEKLGDYGRAFDVVGFDADVSFTSSSFTGFATNEVGGAARISTAGNVTVADVVAAGNDAFDGGAAVEIQADGNVSVVGSAFVDNKTVGSGALAVRAASGDVVIEASSFEGNEASAAGGAIIAGVEGSVTISNSTFADNSGSEAAGGLATLVALEGVSVSNSSFTGNSAEGVAGGAYLSSAGSDVSVSNSLFEGNSARVGGGAFILPSFEGTPGGTAHITDTTFTANEASNGGGLWLSPSPDVDGVPAPPAVIERSTFAANSVVAADGIDALGQGAVFELFGNGGVHVINSTFDEPSTSTATPYAIAVVGDGGRLDLLHSTVVGAGAVGVGVAVHEEGTSDPAAVLASHDILESTTDAQAIEAFEAIVEVNPVALGSGDWAAVAGRAASAAAGPLLTDDFFTLEWSVVSTDVDPAIVAEGPGNQLEIDPQLEALADNGGATLTRLPAQGSPAVNTGDPAVEGAPETDQRGAARIVETIDVGAVELAAPEPSLAATGGTVNWTLMIGAAGILLLGAAGLVIARTRKA